MACVKRIASSWSAIRNYLQLYKDTIDYLYKTEPIAMINLTVHAHFGGRPLISAMLVEILKYMKDFSGVRFLRHDEIARWVLNHVINPNQQVLQSR